MPSSGDKGDNKPLSDADRQHNELIDVHNILDQAKHGSVQAQEDMLEEVRKLQKNGDLKAIGQALQKSGEAHVRYGAKGEPEELVFNDPDGKTPVLDVNLSKNTVNGKSADALKQSELQQSKDFLDARSDRREDLNDAEKSSVKAIEHAFLDGDYDKAMQELQKAAKADGVSPEKIAEALTWDFGYTPKATFQNGKFELDTSPIGPKLVVGAEGKPSVTNTNGRHLTAQQGFAAAHTWAVSSVKEDIEALQFSAGRQGVQTYPQSGAELEQTYDDDFVAMQKKKSTQP